MTPPQAPPPPPPPPKKKERKKEKTCVISEISTDVPLPLFLAAPLPHPPPSSPAPLSRDVSYRPALMSHCSLMELYLCSYIFKLTILSSIREFPFLASQSIQIRRVLSNMLVNTVRQTDEHLLRLSLSLSRPTPSRSHSSTPPPPTHTLTPYQTTSSVTTRPNSAQCEVTNGAKAKHRGQVTEDKTRHRGQVTEDKTRHRGQD